MTDKNKTKFDFTNRVVLVTAGSKGIGFAIAKGFCKFGAKVAICSRDKNNLENAVNEINSCQNGEIVGFECDLKEKTQCELLVQKVEDYYSSSIDILINNSGGPPAKNIVDTSDMDWDDAIKANLLSSILLSKKIVNGMIKKNWGRIVFLTSVLSKEPAEGMVLSNVTRAGIAAFSKTLSREVAKYGVTVNTILTGGCKTDRFYSLVKKQIDQSDETLDHAVGRLSETVPVGHISTPDEFAQTILFLSSDEASYINGVSLPLDGGASKGVF